MWVDFKVTTWERVHLPDNLTEDELSEIKRKVSEQIIQTWDDLEEECGDISGAEKLMDTEEYISPDDNAGAPTIEIFDDGDVIASNSI